MPLRSDSRYRLCRVPPKRMKSRNEIKRTKCNGEEKNEKRNIKNSSNITSWWLCKTISFNKNLNNVLFYTFPVSRQRNSRCFFKLGHQFIFHIVARNSILYKRRLCSRNLHTIHNVACQNEWHQNSWPNRPSYIVFALLHEKRYAKIVFKEKKIVIRTLHMKRGQFKWETLINSTTHGTFVFFYRHRNCGREAQVRYCTWYWYKYLHIYSSMNNS